MYTFVADLPAETDPPVHPRLCDDLAHMPMSDSSDVVLTSRQRMAGAMRGSERAGLTHESARFGQVPRCQAPEGGAITERRLPREAAASVVRADEQVVGPQRVDVSGRALRHRDAGGVLASLTHGGHRAGRECVCVCVDLRRRRPLEVSAGRQTLTASSPAGGPSRRFRLWPVLSGRGVLVVRLAQPVGCRGVAAVVEEHIRLARIVLHDVGRVVVTQPVLDDDVAGRRGE
jgi:hypothetical protein